MSVKEEVLKTLEENRGNSFSGEALASALGVSRAAVWKAINSLRKEGYPVEAVTNKGYMLTEESDVLSEHGIRMHLENENRQITLHIHKVLDSTNLEAKRLALSGAEHGSVIIANEQTKGRGRLGRDFFSPASDGLYLSLLLKPNFDLSQSVLITTAASVAVCRAIEKVCGASTEIKWVNDVYYNGKKLCGILTGAITDFETGTIEYIALGIGINCYSPNQGFPDEIADKAGALNLSLSRNALAAEVINQVLSTYESLDTRGFIPEYKHRSMVLGKTINVMKHYSASASKAEADSQVALALDIDDNGGLLVEYEDGSREVLSTGEISIRF